MTRIPELEQELVAPAERLRSPRRRVVPAARAVLAAAVAAVVVLMVVVTTSEDDADRRSQPAGTQSSAEPPAELREPVTRGPPGADLKALPTRKSCGHFRIAPPGDYPLILVEVVKGRVPCRVARSEAIEAARPWVCTGPEGLVVCHRNAGPHHKAIRARFPPKTTLAP